MPNRAAWAGISIVVVWLAVLFVGLFDGDAAFRAGSAAGDHVSIPVVWGVALIAMLATIAIARFGFRD